ncbi:hypothetical protein NUSPORA_01732 [Nucleospora cyclopteri]
MYEQLLAFLLGKKSEFTKEDIDEFIKLLTDALEIVPEYQMIEKKYILDNPQEEAVYEESIKGNIVSNAIDKILNYEIEDPEENYLKKRPTRIEGKKGGKFFNVARPIEERFENSGNLLELKLNEEVKRIDEGVKRIDEEIAVDLFKFDISELESIHKEGPEFEFDIEESCS